MDYKTKEARALFLVANKAYGSLQDLACSLDVSRQYISNCLRKHNLSLKKGHELSKKHPVHPAIFNYEVYLLLGGDIPYKSLWTEFFTKQEWKYIINGETK